MRGIAAARPRLALPVDYRPSGWPGCAAPATHRSPSLSMPIKPRTPSGVMELLPRDQIAFQRMLDTIRRTFEQFGFLPVETPVMELSDVLLTKSGGDTERQVYFVQSTGALDNKSGGDGEATRPELALRFDLTVPLARYVAEHEHELAFPFRRYQMQRVYRGERAQSGRYREFYQCDIDVIGKDTLSTRFDAEIPAVIAAVFEHLAFGDFTIHFNHRKFLRGFFEGLGIGDGDRQTAVLRELDKLDKRGPDAVRATLAGEAYALPADTVDALMAFSQVRSTSHTDALAKLDAFPQGTPLFEEGRAELRAVLAQLQALGVSESRYALNLSIARGLDYYTGIVYETFLDAHPQIGSICSGGRYDNLASHYTKSKLPGVGISIGLTRLFYQLQKAGLVATAASSVDVLVALMDDAQLPDALALSQRLRAAGLNVETQLEPRKLAKQLQYADRAGIRFVAIRGENEAARGVIAVKDMDNNEQFEVAEAALPAKLQEIAR